MTESEQNPKPIVAQTTCYTYEVTMLIQILAKDEIEAKERLDREGGYISRRDVVLKHSTTLYSTDEPFIDDTKVNPNNA
jgi:hypothetical protein